ncbi:MAG: hypothetical protein AB7L91_06345 [Dehalococcoidia bacterium]
MSGSRGPLSKPEGTRRRRNATPGADTIVVRGKVPVPQAPADLHPVAKRWYQSLRRSGQSRRYEPSDWAAALYCAELMSRLLKARKPSAEMAGVVWRMMTDLLTTEMSRRRARIEIERVLLEAMASSEPVSFEARRAQLGEVEEDAEEAEGIGEGDEA